MAQHVYRSRRTTRMWWTVAIVVVAAAVVAGVIVIVGKHHANAAGANGSGNGGSGGPTSFTVASTTPGAGAKSVQSDATVTVELSADLASGGAMPSLSPAVTGLWRRTSARTLSFEATAPFTPGTAETLTIPGGASGLKDTQGSTLPATTTIHFSVATGSTLRLQQLLSQLNYLPVKFNAVGGTPAANEMAQPQGGSFSWRWNTLPPDFVAEWQAGDYGSITKGAVMTFENLHHLTVDGLAGPEVWAALLKDAAAGAVDPNTWDYFYVNKNLPETLNMWVNGVLKAPDVAVNTGAPGADTTDGTYAVFEHVTASEMKGTFPDGSTYDDPSVPWASYFHGGDALHGFARATYGSYQSNGCVEMPIATAGQLWPYSPIGTLVTVVGPAS